MAAVGIDFGLTNSCVGIWRNEGVEIIANDQGNRTSPSLVGFNDQEQLAGEAAKSQADTNTANTVYDIKTLLGRKYSDPEIQAKKAQWPFKVVAGKDDELLVEVSFKGKKLRISAEDLAGKVLQDMKNLAKSYLGKEVAHAVISVPVDFTDVQKKALKSAASKIKLNVLRFINEPTAAAISYGYDTKEEGAGKKNVCVLDFGGGSCEVSMMCVQDGVISITAQDSDSKLGGRNFDDRLVDHFKKEFERKNKTKIEGDDSERAMAKLRAVCEKAKMSLASGPQAPVQVDPLFNGKEMYSSISRARFEMISNDLFQSCLALLKKVIQQANMTPSDVDTLVMVGGCSRMPKLKQIVKEFMGKVSVVDSINPNEAVACGAAIQASLLGEHFSSPDLDKIPAVNVSALTLGLGVAGGVAYPLIPRGTPVPCSRTIATSTATDNQTSVLLTVVEGECLKTDANDVAASFTLTGLDKAGRGVPQIDVTFALDESGELTVSAEEKTSKKSKQLVVKREAAAKDVSKRIEPSKKQQVAGKAVFAQLTAVRDLRSYAESLQKNIQDKSQDDSSGKIAKSCQEVLTWLIQAEPSIPALGDIVLKRVMLEASTAEDEEDDEEDDDEGDEGESTEEDDDDEELD